MTTRMSRLAAARLILGFFAIVVPTANLAAPAPVRAATIAVAVEDFDFSPASRTIAVGDVVRWSFSGNPHSVTSRDGLFDSGIKDAGGSFQFRFAKAGTYRYYCMVHPGLMSGTIVVKAASATPKPTVRPTATPTPTPKPTARATVKPTATPAATPTQTTASASTSPAPSTAPSDSPGASGAVAETPGPTTVPPSVAPASGPPASAGDTTPMVAGGIVLVAVAVVGGLLLARRRRST
jgi:plastocyanin